MIVNAAVRLITGQNRREHISGTLRELHWLRVPQRVTYKVASLARRSLHHQGPQYLTEHLNPIHAIQARSHLRSANRGDLIIPRSITSRAGGRGFRISGPRVWNSLPPSLRRYEYSCPCCKPKLDTHLFT